MIVSIIIEIEHKAAAEAAVIQIAPESQGESFLIRLSASGQEPATHVACQPLLSESAYESVADMSRSGLFGFVAFSVVQPDSTTVEDLQSLAESQGLRLIVLDK